MQVEIYCEQKNIVNATANKSRNQTEIQSKKHLYV